jgi:hypothetical protein
VSEKGESRKTYVYNFRSFPRHGDDPGADQADQADQDDQENLLSIKQSLLLLTGGCDISERQDGLFCEKHGRPLRPGESRCDFVVERFSRAEAEVRSKEQIQRYVNEILGVKDPKSIKRLTG